MGDEKSIIQIIQKMVQENEPEQKIVDTLKSMGVAEDQARRLLLIAQADTFTLLKSEIDKIVQEKVDEKKRQIEEDSKKFIDVTIETKKKEVRGDLDKEFMKYKLSLSEAQKGFQDSVSDSISKVAKLNEEVYAISEDNKKTIATVEKDLTETKLKGIKMRRSLTRNILILFGLLCFAASLGLVTGVFIQNFNVDYIAGAISMSLIGATLIYLSANI